MFIKKGIIQLLIFICFYSIYQNAFCENNDSTKSKIGILPVAYYGPETRIGGGFIFFSYFKTSLKDSTTRKSNTQTYLDFTINKQLLFQTDYSIFSNKNKFYFKGHLDYIHFPEYYYGIGNSTNESMRRLIDFNSIIISSRNYVLTKKKTYIGILLEHQSLYMLNQMLMSYSEDREVVGHLGYSTTGAGIGVLIDNRNNQLNPESGHYFELNFSNYFNHSRNQSGFNSFVLDARYYKKIIKKLVWNSNFYTSLNRGSVPFRLMPAIGGARFLRGYYQGRFRDNNLILLQHEFRYQVYKRWGIALFSGIGQVAKELNQFSMNQFHYNYGAGIRFKVDRKENTNIRIDLGITKDSKGIYIVFAEAF